MAENGSSPPVELLRVAAGGTAALFHWDPSLTHDLAAGLRGLRGLSVPSCSLDGIQIDDVRSDVLRQLIAVASDLEFLPGTISENIHLSRPRVSESNLCEACDAVGLTESLRLSGLSLSTRMLPNGWPLNPLQQRRLVLARALADKPRVLFIDHLCDLFAEADLQQLWQQLSRYRSHTTVLVATVREDFAQLIGNVMTGPLSDHRQETRTHSC